MCNTAMTVYFSEVDKVINCLIKSSKSEIIHSIFV